MSHTQVSVTVEDEVKRRQCQLCFKVLARPGDMPRHNRTHLDPQEKLDQMYGCPWPTCGYRNLQSSNVETHLRTHTKEQNQICPDCDFKTSDPGSLTRHRKRHHGYVPKPRKQRARVPSPPATASPASVLIGPWSFGNIFTAPAASPAPSPEPLMPVVPGSNYRLISTPVSPSPPRSPLSLPDGRSLISDDDEQPYYSFMTTPRSLAFVAAATATPTSMCTTASDEYEWADEARE